MNVLILTPDAVGSTLLQRMLTIYMQFHQFDRPTINLHELTNGLAKYYSPEFNQELVGKRALANWGYHQTLPQVTELLSSVDHYKTSRLAHYHIVQRGDKIEDQIPFYQYLNDNFYIIACRRANVFEHALSMALNRVTKKLNVYNAYEKIDTFYDIHRCGIKLDPAVFVDQLNAYKQYINWSKQHFNIGSYFNYEQDIPRLEQFILDLPVFAGQPEIVTWKKNFGISLDDWNKLHYAYSDIGNIALSHSTAADLMRRLQSNNDQVSDYQQHAPAQWPPITELRDFDDLPVEIKNQFLKDQIQKQGLFSLLPADRQQSLQQFRPGYEQARKTIDQMIQLGIIINGPPIKKQTLNEKRKTIKNFDFLIENYNHWAMLNPDISAPVSDQELSTEIRRESAYWNTTVESDDLQHNLLPTQQ